MRPESNTSRVKRAAVIIDCDQYYKAVYEAIQNAKNCIFIIGWDIHSRIELLRGDDCPDPDRSYAFLDVLKRKALENPDMRFYLLKWESSLIYGKEQEYLPALIWRFKTPDNINFCLDHTAPYGASHHQKIIAIDDKIAFSGGMDIALGRWDTFEHKAENEWRKDPLPRGSYAPYHDIQMLVDGDAARRLSELARWRWERAVGFAPVPLQEGGTDVWPSVLKPHFRDISVQISQTFPRTAYTPALREIEPLLMDHIRQAEHFIFIENQFLTHLPIAEALNRRLREKPNLRLLILSSYNPQGPLEKAMMWQGRIAFREKLMEGLKEESVMLCYPVSLNGEGNDVGIRVHAKLMIIDDRILHVGAANLNSRSMGTDSECDLTCRAETPEHCMTIASLRNILIAGHAGKTIPEVEEVVAGEKPLKALVGGAAGSHRALRLIDDRKFREKINAEILKRFGDYDTPLLSPDFDYKIQTSEPVPPWRRFIFKILWGLAAFTIAGLVYLVMNNESVIANMARDLLASRRSQGTAFSLYNFILASGIFSLLAFLSFPVTAMIPLIASLYGPVAGFLYALCGVVISAAAGFTVGHGLGITWLKRFFGPRLHKIDILFAKAGLVNIAILRNLPLAPYGIVNLAAGVSSVRFSDFIAGTILGMLPGMAALVILGDSLGEVITDLNVQSIFYLLLGIAVWTGFVILVHKFSKGWQRWGELA